MPEQANLEGKVAVVTGGTRGIGMAIARALLDAGARVTVTGAREDSRASAAAAFQPAGDRLRAVVADVRRPADVQRAIDETTKAFGGLDILINNAGIGRFVSVADMSADEWHAVIETNLSGVFHCCRAAIPHLRARGGGWIVNISSLAGKNAFTGGAAYCASKAGLNAFSEALMQEVRYDGIRVSYVMPGSVNTAFGGHAGSGEDWKLSADDVAEVVMDLLRHPGRSLPSRVELRPSRPRK